MRNTHFWIEHWISGCAGASHQMRSSKKSSVHSLTYKWTHNNILLFFSSFISISPFVSRDVLPQFLLTTNDRISVGNTSEFKYRLSSFVRFSWTENASSVFFYCDSYAPLFICLTNVILRNHSYTEINNTQQGEHYDNKLVHEKCVRNAQQKWYGTHLKWPIQISTDEWRKKAIIFFSR